MMKLAVSYPFTTAIVRVECLGLLAGRIHDWADLPESNTAKRRSSRYPFGPVAGLVGIEGGVVSGVINLEITRR